MTDVLGRAVLELGVDAKGLFRDLELQFKALGNKVQTVFGKDLKNSFKGIDDAVDSLKKFAGEANPVLDTVGNLTGKLGGMAEGMAALGPAGLAAGVALGAVAVAGGAVIGIAAALGSEMLSLTRHAADAGDELLNLSNKTGLTVEAVSELKFVSQQTDVPLETITNSIVKFGQTLAENGDKAKNAVAKLGLSMTQLRGMKPEQAFTTIITKLHEIPDAGQRAALGVALFGKQFKEIAGLTQEDMKGLIDQAHALGLVMSTEFAVAGDRFNDDLAAMGSQIDALKMKIGADFLPVAISFVEIFGKNFVQALAASGTQAQKFSELMSDVAVLTGQAAAAIIFVIGLAGEEITKFAAGASLTNLGLIDFFGSVVDAIAATLSAMALLNPALSSSADNAAALGQKIHAFASTTASAILQASNAAVTASKAAQQAAIDTMVQLPGKVSAVKAEIAATAEAMRKAKADAAGFGGELDLAGDKSDKLAKEQAQVAKEVAHAQAEIAALSAIISDFGACVDMVVESEGRWASDLRQLPLTDVVGKMQAYDMAAEQATAQNGVLTAAFKTLGITSRAELQQIADKALQAYQVISQQLGKTSPEAIEAFRKWKEAAAAAAGQTKKSWGEVFPYVKGIIGQMGTAIEGTFAQMLLHAKGFKDGFLDIWKSLKAGIAQILTEILGDFVSRFLKGLLAALTGAQGGFASAFKGLLGGGLGSLLGGGTAFAGAPGLVGIGGTVPGLPGAAGTGAAAGIGLGGILGGIGAGGAGIGLGLLFKNLFGGAGAGAGLAGGASGAATGALIGSIVPGLGTAIGALIGGLSGLISGWFGKSKGMKANDARDAFFEQYGAAHGGYKPGGDVGSTFNDLAGKLTEATGEAGGGHLFKELQDADTVEKVAVAIQHITAALDEYEQKTKAAAVTTDAAVEAQKTKYAELKAEIVSQLDGVNAKIEDINRSEKPEAHMGVIERAQRDALERQKDLYEKALADIEQEAKDAIAAAGKTASGTVDAMTGPLAQLPEDFLEAGRNCWVRFRDGLGDMRIPAIHIPTITDMPIPHGPAIPMASGGFGTVHMPTLFLAGERGPEQFAFSGGGKTFDSRSGGTAKPSVLIGPVYLNGRPSDSERRAMVREFVAQVPGVLADGGQSLGDWNRMVKHMAAAK